MAKRTIEEATLSALGDVIRRKTGRNDLLTPEEGMITALETLEDSKNQTVTEIDLSSHTWQRGMLEPNSNKIVGASSYGLYTISFVDLYQFAGTESSLEFSGPEDCLIRLSVVDRDTGVSEDAHYVKWAPSGVVDVSACDNHSLFLSVKYSDGRELNDSAADSLAALVTVKIISGASAFTSDVPETLGQLACLARIRQLRDIQYTPVADLPYNGGTYAAGTLITGLPYSSVRKTDKFIGYNVSLHTFMTALHNPQSVLYTKESSEYHAKTWYGTNCSTFVSYAYDFPYHNPTAIFADMDCIEPIDVADMKLCDAANMIEEGASGGHIVIISGIVRNGAGNIVTVEISESDGIGVSRTTMSYEAFRYEYLQRQGYRMYRNKDLYKVGYTASAYIPLFPEEPTDAAVYSDLCTDLGDKATILAGESITLHPLATEGYTAMKLYRQGTEVGSYSVGERVLTGLTAGKYTAKLCPEAGNAETKFIVCGASVSQEGIRYSFSGEYGTPIRVVFKDSTGFTVKAVDLTEEDVELGYADIDYADETVATVCVPFRNDYGFVVAQCSYTLPSGGTETPEEPDMPDGPTEGLPKEYQQVSCIETDGGQYIDTGVLASDYPDGITYHMTGHVTQVLSASSNNWFWGALADGKRSGNLSYWGAENGGNFRLFAGGSETLLQHSVDVVGLDVDVTVTAAATAPDAATGTINGTAMTRQSEGTATDMPAAHIYLMRCNGASSGSWFCGRLYKFTMTAADGSAIRKFVPCYRVADNAIGLYDTVEGSFHENAGTGSFTKGEDVVTTE